MDQPIKLTVAERVQLNRHAVKDLVQMVSVQALTLVLLSVLTWVLFTGYAALSLLWGGLSYLLPTSLFVLYMVLKLKANQNASPFAFFYAEAFKLGGTLIMFVVGYTVLGVHMVWLALFVGLLVVLKAYLLLLVFKKV